jgi:hypothetical protein
VQARIDVIQLVFILDLNAEVIQTSGPAARRAEACTGAIAA